MWNQTDPREALTDHKSARVVVSNGKLAVFADCQMKHSWCVWLNGMMNGLNFLGDTDNWPKEWVWAKLPTQAEIQDGRPNQEAPNDPL